MTSLRVGAGSAATTVAVQQITHVARHLIRYLGSAGSQRDTPLAPARSTIGCDESGGNLAACGPAASAGAGAQRDSRRLSVFSKTRAGSSPMRKNG